MNPQRFYKLKRTLPFKKKYNMNDVIAVFAASLTTIGVTISKKQAAAIVVELSKECHATVSNEVEELAR